MTDQLTHLVIAQYLAGSDGKLGHGSVEEFNRFLATGCRSLYVYGKDEAHVSELPGLRPVYQAVGHVGVTVAAALCGDSCRPEHVPLMADVLNAAILAGAYSDEEAKLSRDAAGLFHQQGQKL